MAARSALIVASYDYRDPGLRRLRAPSRDAEALGRVLEDPQIGGFDVRTMLNEPAHVVAEAVEEFFADRAPDDMLLVHFSCHGIKDEGGELYLAAANTKLNRLGATAVPAEFVNRRMGRSRSRRVVLLLDCCYAGAFERGMLPRADAGLDIEGQFGGRGRAVITASSAMEYAFEGAELTGAGQARPSVFTSALVEGLATGEADRDHDGRVGLDELYDYVYDQVRATTPHQTPGKWTFGVQGELVIARRSRPVTTPVPLPAELQQVVDHPLAGIRAGVVQELARLLAGRHAGLALAARRALERLAEDDSRAVSAAAETALGPRTPPTPPARPAPPRLELSESVLDFGRLTRGDPSPRRTIRLADAGGGTLDAHATATAAWIELHHIDDELAVAVDTATAGDFEGTITVDGDGGSAAVRVVAHIDPAAAPPRPRRAAELPERPDTAPAAHEHTAPLASGPVLPGVAAAQAAVAVPAQAAPTGETATEPVEPPTTPPPNADDYRPASPRVPEPPDTPVAVASPATSSDAPSPPQPAAQGQTGPHDALLLRWWQQRRQRARSLRPAPDRPAAPPQPAAQDQAGPHDALLLKWWQRRGQGTRGVVLVTSTALAVALLLLSLLLYARV